MQSIYLTAMLSGEPRFLYVHHWRLLHKKQTLVVLELLVKRSNNILFCVLGLDRKYCRWNSATTTLESIHQVHLHRKCHKTRFTHYLITTIGNLIWPVFFLFLCSWCPAEEQYLIAVLIIQKVLLKSLLKVCLKKSFLQVH